MVAVHRDGSRKLEVGQVTDFGRWRSVASRGCAAVGTLAAVFGFAALAPRRGQSEAVRIIGAKNIERSKHQSRYQGTGPAVFERQQITDEIRHKGE
jgi:hypothetical protein